MSSTKLFDLCGRVAVVTGATPASADEALNRLRTQQSIKTAKINCGHMCVLTDPAQTARALTELA